MLAHPLDWDSVAIQDLPDEMRQLAEVAGMGAVQTLVEMFGGVRIYVPTLKTIRRQQLVERAASLYDGSNELAVCRRLRVTRGVLRTLLEEASEAETSGASG